jgi:hypothetical protein
VPKIPDDLSHFATSLLNEISCREELVLVKWSPIISSSSSVAVFACTQPTVNHRICVVHISPPEEEQCKTKAGKNSQEPMNQIRGNFDRLQRFCVVLRKNQLPNV